MGERQDRMAAVVVVMALANGCIGREQEMPPPPAPPAPVTLPAAPKPAPIPAAPPVFEEQPPAEAPAAPTAAPKPAGLKKPESEPVRPEPAAAAAPAQPAPAVAGPCGDDDQPACPLQGWMEKNLQQPFDEDRFAQLGPALERVAKMAPDPSWNAGATGWAAIAQAGATAARNADQDGVKQSCKGCHKAWRNKYKSQFRTRAIE